MQILVENNVSIFYESDPKVLVCYKDDALCGMLPYPKSISNIYQLRDDARDWYEQWIKPRAE